MLDALESEPYTLPPKLNIRHEDMSESGIAENVRNIPSGSGFPKDRTSVSCNKEILKDWH